MITATALARRLNVDRSTLRRWTLEGSLPPPDLLSPGGRRLYSARLADAITRGAFDRTSVRWRLADALRLAFEAAELAPLEERHAERLAVALLEDDRVAIL